MIALRTLLARLGLFSLMMVFTSITVAQVSNADQQPPATSPPGLLLLIVVDDSSTMNQTGNSLNSAETALGPNANLRDVTDNTMRRWHYVGRLLSILQADTQATHEVAVLSFDGDINGWLSGTSGAPFVRLGAGSTPANFNALMDRVTNPEPGAQPGDTVEAFEEAVLPVMRERLAANGNAVIANLKPVVLLITDDVPIRQWPDSPWKGVNLWRQSYHQAFVELVGDLTGVFTYGTLDNSPLFCRQAGGQTLLVTVPMGAANWVNAVPAWGNGTGRLTRQGNGQYFQQIARAEGLLRRPASPDTPASEPLVYPVDPLLGDQATLETDLRTAFDDILRELRCQPGENVGNPTQVGNVRSFTTTLSPLMVQAQFVLDEGARANVQVLDPANNPLPSNLVKVSAPAGAGYQVWTLNRKAIRDAQRPWQGTWTVRVTDGNSGQWRLLYDLDVTGLSWEWLGYTETSREARLRLLQNNRAIHLGQRFVADLSLRLINRTTDEPLPQSVPLRPANDLSGTSSPIYIANIDAEDELGVALVLRLNNHPALVEVGLAGAQIAFPPLDDARISPPDSEPSLIIRDPERVRCGEPGITSVPFRVEVAGLNEQPALRDSFFSYVEMQVEHRYPTTGQWRRVMRLEWDLGGLAEGADATDAFRGEFDCERLNQLAQDQADGGGLAPQPEQALQVVARLPGGNRIPGSLPTFVYHTPTPTLTPRPPPTTFPTPRPTEFRVTLATEIEHAVTTPPNNLFLLLSCLVLFIVGLVMSLRFVIRWERPLGGVVVVRHEGAQRSAEPVLRPWQHLLYPTKATIKHHTPEGPIALFELQAQDDSLRLKALAEPLMVGRDSDQEALARSDAPKTIDNEMRVIYEHQGQTITLDIFDYNSKRRRLSDG